MADDLTSLKDDMNAFIVGHGLGLFRAYVSEEVQSVLWDANENPDAWKDFVELAKQSGVAFLTFSEDTLDREDVDFLIQRLTSSAAPDDEELEDARWLRSHIGRVGFLQLGFSYHGSIFLYEVSTTWYDRYQQLLDIAENFGSIIMDEGDDER